MSTLLLGLALTVAAPSLKDPPKKDATIVGEWEVESITSGGRMSTTAPGLVYTFTNDGNWLIYRDGKELVSTTRTFVLDPKANPPTVDLSTNNANAAAVGTKLVGIFKIEKDTLTICGTRQQGAERPTKFESPEGTAVVMYVLKRVKKD